MVDKSAIVRIAEEVRREECRGDDEAPCWSVGMCQFVSRVLEQRLTAAGFAPHRVDGFHVAAARGKAGAASSLTTTWDGLWLHWWIECEGFVVDVLADRFNSPQAPEAAMPAVVVLPKDAAPGYQVRLPLDEPASTRTRGRPFEQ